MSEFCDIREEYFRYREELVKRFCGMSLFVMLEKRKEFIVVGLE